LIEDAVMPMLGCGDLLAVPMAGAYCLAMASNYNLAPRPAAVLVNDGEVRVIRRRESYADLLQCEVVDPRIEPGIGMGSLSARKGSL
jgi:diaminopimelate decarboxylase